MAYDISKVTLTLNADLLLDWSVRDIADLEKHSGLSMPEWAAVMTSETQVTTRALRAWCWVENRRRWPNFPLSAVDEIPYGKFLDLINADQESKEQAVEDADAVAEAPLVEAQVGPTS